MLTQNERAKRVKGQGILYLAALFTGVSSVVSGIVLFRVFVVPDGADQGLSSQVYFVVGIIFQLFMSIVLLMISSVLKSRFNNLPSIRDVASDIRKFDVTTHVYAMISALVGGISILIIVLPAYGKFGTMVAAVLYVIVPALSNGIADFVWNTSRKEKPAFGLLLLLSVLALFAMSSKSVIDLSSFGSFFESLLGNVELMLSMGLAFGIFIMIGDQTLKRGIKYSKDLPGIQEHEHSFVFLRIFWLAALGIILGIAEAIGHGGLDQFGLVLNDALQNRFVEFLLFIGLVQAVGAGVNFLKGLLLGSYNKTPSEVAIGVGVSGVVTFFFTAFLIRYTEGFLKETSVDISLLPQKVVAAIAIVLIIYAFSRLKGNGIKVD